MCRGSWHWASNHRGIAGCQNWYCKFEGGLNSANVEGLQEDSPVSHRLTTHPGTNLQARTTMASRSCRCLKGPDRHISPSSPSASCSSIIVQRAPHNFVQGMEAENRFSHLTQVAAAGAVGRNACKRRDLPYGPGTGRFYEQKCS